MYVFSYSSLSSSQPISTPFQHYEKMLVSHSSPSASRNDLFRTVENYYDVSILSLLPSLPQSHRNNPIMASQLPPYLQGKLFGLILLVMLAHLEVELTISNHFYAT